MAWSDRPWILEGAAVRVSMIGFDDGNEISRTLDGQEVSHINADLTGQVDITKAKQLTENENIAFRGNQKGGSFDIGYSVAKDMMEASNSSGRSNKDVIKPWWNGLDITRRPRNMWLIDFGTDISLEEASLYEAPLQYVEQHVKVHLDTTSRKESRDRWWLHIRPRPEMREAIAQLDRYLATPHVSKHRLWLWIDAEIIPDHQLIVVASENDYFFGVLHSRIHELWALRMGTSLEDRPRYTPTTTFETFPFPWPPGQEPIDHPAYTAISEAARRLHEEREAWLNPPGVPESRLKDRTLTNLYNALLVFREVPPPPGRKHPKIKPAAGDFAPRLDALHRKLDRAVCDAYGWEHAVLDDDEEILRRLLALNLARAGQGQ